MPVLRVLSRPPTSDPFAWITGCDYKRIESLAELDAYITPAILNKTPVGVDFEANSLDVWTPDPRLRVVGVNISIAPGVSRYVPVGHLVGYEKNLPWHEVLQRLWYLDTHGVPLVFYSAKYDHELLYHCARHVAGIPDHWFPSAHFEECLFAVWLTDCHHKTFGLKSAALRLLGLTMPSYKDVVEGRNFSQLDPDEAVIYGCSDADMTLRLWLDPRVQAAVRRQREVYRLERALIEPFRTMLRNGQWWDDAWLAQLEADLGPEVKARNGKIVTPASGRIGALSARIRELAGPELNFDAPAQIGAFLQAIQLAIVETTDSDQTATGKEILQKYRCKHADTCDIALFRGHVCTCGHTCTWGQNLIPRKRGGSRSAPPQYVTGWLCRPVIHDIIMRRELTAAARNYVLKIRQEIALRGPKLHWPFNQIGAPTGRMSAGGEKKAREGGMMPANEQSMTDAKKQPYLPDIRAGLIANDPRLDIAPDDPEGFDVVACDFSQIELRVGANLSKEPAWIQAFRDKVDIHLANARLAYQDPAIPLLIPDPANPAQLIENPKRGKGKTMGFAVLFGAEDETVAEHGNITVAEAATLLANFWTGAPVLRRWTFDTHATARCEKVVRTFLGRERPLREWYNEETLGHRSPKAWLARKGDREAVNSQIQGGAAEIFKIAFVRVHNLLAVRGWHAHCQIVAAMHDELVFYVRRRLRDEIVPAILDAMTVRGWPAPPGSFTVRDWPVAITAEAEIGPNWGKTLHKYRVPVVLHPCDFCGAPIEAAFTRCQGCAQAEASVGDIVAVRAHVPLFQHPDVDPRLDDRARVRPVR